MAVKAQNGAGLARSMRLIRLLGAAKSGKTVTAASISKTFPAELPAKEPTQLDGLAYKMYDLDGVAALLSLNLYPEYVFDMTGVAKIPELFNAEREVAAEIQRLKGRAVAVIHDSASAIQSIIGPERLSAANENSSALAYGRMVQDYAAIMNIWKSYGAMDHVLIEHLKAMTMFSKTEDAKKTREVRLKALGLPGTIEYASSLPESVAKFWREQSTATFVQRRVPQAGKPTRYTIIAEDGLVTEAGSRWAPFLKSTEFPARLRAIVEAVDSRQIASGMPADEYTITPKDLAEGAPGVQIDTQAAS